MATRPFSYSFAAMAGLQTFRLPFEPQGAIVIKVDGATVTGTLASGVVTLTTALTVPASVSVTGTTAGPARRATAPGTAITALTQSTGGTVSNSLPSFALVPSLSDGSTGTSGGNTIAAVTDITTAKNAIATIAAKVSTLAQQNTAVRNALATLGAKDNEAIAILKASGLAT